MLVTVAELGQALDCENVVLFDCRFQLMRPAAGREAYLAGHLPNAFYLDLEQDLSGRKGDHGGRHPLPDAIELASKFGAAGVQADTLVVVYDAGEGMAPRAWWLLRYLGHANVAVLDGGLPAWVAAGHHLSTDIPMPRPATFVAHVQTDWVVDVHAVKSRLGDPDAGILLDARAPERYRGEVEPIDPVAGHIPGAVNLPWTDNLSDDGRWKDPETLRQQFASIVNSSGQIDDVSWVVYCGSGVTACANLFALHLAGMDETRLYAGSWSDWCSYPAIGDAPASP